MRNTLPQRATRHALLSEGAHGLAGSSPVRRGIAVAAVVGGALSVAGVAVAVDRLPLRHDAVDDELASIGLAADGQTDNAATHDASTDVTATAADNAPADDEPGTTGSPVLDTSALAKTVREANEEGRRLADEQKSDRPDETAVVATTTAAATTVPPLADARRTASKPGELIDTNDWYLTLPTGKKGSPDTIDGSQLATYHSKFFDLTSARDGIVFSAGADGVTTKNSHYPRSELREMDGSEKASWSNTSGTHVFDVREAFTKLPSAKPEVVGVQIHDAEDDVMQIRLEGKKLMVQYHDGRSEAVLDPDYQLGTPFDTRIVAANGKVDVLYNGEKKAELPLSGSGWYWKVGAYVQSNGSTGDGADSTGEVVVYKADVSHSGASATQSE
ncbi:MAG: polysaccharide lyase family 7 protein [Pseudonocardia sp.]|nr:polysaccharide lyase family 7 protein [Pseudonocardia sp.]